jgi:ataxin-3
METIFHEKQEGQLCAQHALNALLQGPYFTPVDLGTLAQQCDDEERKKMAEGGESSEEYQKFIASGSNNMDDSGFFSIQVMASALKVWGLDMLNYASQNIISDAARQDPTSQKAFICNFQEHWFTIRKMGNQWFNLNSLLSGPELISDTYLSLQLTQLQQEGYSIFVVNGIFPECRADQVLSTTQVTQSEKPSLLNEGIKKDTPSKTGARGNDGFTEEERQQMQQAIQASMASTFEDERKQLEAAMALSLGGDTRFMTEEEQLDQAMRMSLEGTERS